MNPELIGKKIMKFIEILYDTSLKNRQSNEI